MGLYRRIPRELKANLPRYLALFFLVALCMYIVVSLVAAADTIIEGVDSAAEENLREDGQFTVFSPLTGAQLDRLDDAGVTVERMFYLDFELEDGSVLRVFNNRERVNLVHPDESQLAAGGSELLLEKLYAGANHLAVGETMIIGDISFTVSGIGSSPDYDYVLQELSDVTTDQRQFGTAFVTDEAYQRLKNSGQSLGSEEYLYTYRLCGAMTHKELKELIREFTVDRDAISDAFLLMQLDELDAPRNELLDNVAALVEGGASLQEALDTLGASGADLSAAASQIDLPPELSAVLSAYTDGVQDTAEASGTLRESLEALQRQTEELADEAFGYEIRNLTSFLEAENNPRIAASADDVTINKASGILAGVIALVLFAYVISVFVVHTVDSESEVIGTLYAMGAPKGTLLRHYLVLPVIVALLGGICGTALGFSPIGVTYQMQDTAGFFSYPQPEILYPPYLLVYGLVLPPVVTALVTLLVINGRLSRSPLKLLRREQGKVRAGGIRLKHLGFIRLFKIRQILREKRAALAVCGGMFIALLLLMLGVNCYSLVTNIRPQMEADIRYEYMTSLKYPPETVPADTEACYMKSLYKEIHGYELEVNVLGIDGENPYFDFAPAGGSNALTVSSSVANKFNLKAGDTVYFTDNIEDKSYVFTVDSIVPYAAGLYVFMDIGSARELFGAKKDEYNVLLSDSVPEIEAGLIYAMTSKADFLEYGDIFMEQLTPLFVMTIPVSAAVFVIVLYLMMKMMIDRAAFGISLMKIFGFNDREVRRLYLDGNLITVAVSAVICVPLAKLVMDRIYPYLIANVSMGPDLSLPIWMYAAIFGLIFVSYAVIRTALTGRLKKITPAEVLKQRE